MEQMKRWISFSLSIVLIIGLLASFAFAEGNKFCSNCGKELSYEDRFCSNCGTAVNKDTAEKQEIEEQTDNPADTIEQNYNEACQSLAEGNYYKALGILNKITEYKDSSILINECNYQLGITHLVEQSYASAVDTFRRLKDYKNSEVLAEYASNMRAYSIGVESFNKQNYSRAKDYFDTANGFLNSAEFLSHFSVLHVLNGKHYRVYDNLNNVSIKQCLYKYDEQGRVIEVYSNKGRLPCFSPQIYSLAYAPYDFSWADAERFTYNDDGTLKRIEGTYCGVQEYIVTFKYDENGRPKSEKIITDSDEATAKYKYKSGKLVSIRFGSDKSPFAEYSYNKDGSLKRVETHVVGHKYDIKFRYNEDGTLKRKDVKLFGKDYMKEKYEYNEDGTIKMITYDYEKKTKGWVEISYDYKDLVLWDGVEIEPEVPSLGREDLESMN